MSHKVLILSKSGKVYGIPDLRNYEVVQLEQDIDLLPALAQHRPGAIVTVGQSVPNWNLPFEWRKRWIHVEQASQITENAIGHCFFGSLHHRLDAEHPLVSFFTSTYCSGDRIMRPWKALKAQTYSNWEWVIWDDSPESDHGATFAAVLKLADLDPRVRVYRTKHDGHIGTLKRMACGMAKGSLLVELDHDDSFHARATEWLVQAAKEHPTCQFFYTDCMEVFEDNYEARHYGDGFAFGFGSQMRFWDESSSSWQVHMSVAPINDVTVTHLVGLPNHFRAWRRDFYWSIGGHSDLSVADDYDLLIRSLKSSSPVDASNWCHIMAPAYVQYFSRNGNSFTFKRNALIQHSVNWLRHMKGLQAMPVNSAPVWERTKLSSTSDAVVERRNPCMRPLGHPKACVIFDTSVPEDAMYDKLCAIRRDFRDGLAVIEVGPAKSHRLDKVVDRLSNKNGLTWWTLQGTCKSDAHRYLKLFYGVDLPLIADVVHDGPKDIMDLISVS